MLMELLAEGELEMEDEELSFEDPVKSYVLKVSFKHIKGVSRTIEIAGPQSMHMFHQMIQHAIDWDDDHMYSFFMSNKAWDQTSEIACPFGESEETSDDITFDDLKLKPKQKFLYLFDYGDNHEFEVEVVKINSDAPEQYPDWEDNDE